MTDKNDELVEKIMDICAEWATFSGLDRDETRAEIRELLQSRQPEKPRITREEIEVFFLPKLSTQHLQTYKAKLIISWLKSRCRIKVVEE